MKLRVLACVACLMSSGGAVAQAPNASLLEKQEVAMRALAFLDGEWAGPAEAREPRGTIKMTQTERSGSLLGGTIRLVEGRSFDAQNKTLFNAFAVISYDVAQRRYSITSYASGYATTADLRITNNGFTWDVPAGPAAKMHFVATIKDGVWHEVGDFIGPEGKPRRTFEMTVRKLRTTQWPSGQVSYPPAK